MNNVMESASKLNHIFEQDEQQSESKLEEGFALLTTTNETGDPEDFITLFCCFVNLYLIHGLHLSFPKDGKTHKKEDERSHFSVTRNNLQFFHYVENEEQLEENMDYFLEQVERLSLSHQQFCDLKRLYLGIYYQDKSHFLSLSEDTHSIADYYLFYMAIRDHMYAMEQRKNKQISKEEFSASKEELTLRYRNYEGRKFSFSSPERSDGSVATGLAASRNIPLLPLPTVRYADYLCQDMLASHTQLMALEHTFDLVLTIPHISNLINDPLKKYKSLDDLLREVTEKQQLGNITEKGAKNHLDLCSNIPEIRMEYLMFPLKIDFDRNTFSLLVQNYLDYQALQEKNRALEEKNKELEQQQKERKALISEHSHNWSHMHIPHVLKDISANLKGVVEQPITVTLDRIYSDFLLHKSDLELLKLKYESSNDEVFLNKFRSHLAGALVDDTGTVQTLEHIIAVSLELVLYRLLFKASQDKTHSISSVVSIAELKEKYIQFELDKENELEIFEWFSKEIYPFRVTTRSNDWNVRGFLINEVSYCYMVQLIIDLLNNALNYGVKSREGFIDIILDTELNELNRNYMSIHVENPVDLTTNFMLGSNRGLTSIKASIARLNCSKNPDEFTVIDASKDLFSIHMQIYRLNLKYEPPLDEKEDVL